MGTQADTEPTGQPGDDAGLTFERAWLDYVLRYHRWVQSDRPTHPDGRWFDPDGKPLTPAEWLAGFCPPLCDQLEAALKTLLAGQDADVKPTHWPRHLLVPLSAFMIERKPDDEENVLGRGGMGVVVAAWDRIIERRVAIKFIMPRFRDDPVSVERFKQEARLQGRLGHQGVAPVFHCGEDEARGPFIVMRLLPDFTLKELLKGSRSKGTAEITFLLDVYLKICQTISYAHHEGIAHRDLKPGNIKVGGDGEVWVMDWGLGKGLSAPGTSAAAATDEVDSLLGTLAYMAPEQANSDPHADGKRTDVFLLGGMLCELLTGEPPYTGKTKQELIEAAKGVQLEPAYRRLAAVGPNYAELAALARSCLEKEPAARPESATAVVRMVIAHQTGLAEKLQKERDDRAAERIRQDEKWKRRLQLILLGVMLLMGSVPFGCRFYNHRVQNGQTMTSLLDQCSDALKGDDAVRAQGKLDEVELRMQEGGGSHLSDRLSLCRTDLALLNDLNGIDDERWTVVDNKIARVSHIAGKWKDVFRRYGIVPGQTLPDAAAGLINASLIRERLLMALDSWLVSEPSDHLLAILHAADPHPYRDAVRGAVRANATAQVRALVETPEIDQQPVRFQVAIGQFDGVPEKQRERILRTSVLARPGSVPVLMSLATLKSFDNRERVGVYYTVLALHPNNVVVWSNLGNALNDKKDTEGAIAACRRAIQLAPEFAPAHNNLGNALFRKKDIDGAIASYRKAIRFDPTLARVHANLGNALAEKKLFDEAIASCEEAIRLDANCAPAHNNLGVIRAEQKDPDRAMKHYDDAIRCDPDYPPPHINRGNVLLTKKKYDEAIESFLEAIRRDPTLVAARTNLGSALARKKNYDEAIRCFQEAIRLDPDYAPAHANLGHVFIDRKQFDKAIAACKEAIRLDPAYVLAHVNLANALFLSGDLPGAIDSCNKALALDPKDAEAHNILGHVRFRQKEYGAAIDCYQAAVRFDPDFALAHYSLGTVYLTMQEYENAIKAFRHSIRIEPGYALAHNNLGTALYRIKEIGASMKSYREAIRLDPTLLQAHNNLGNVLLVWNDFDGAVKCFEDALRIAPSNTIVKSNLERALRLKAESPLRRAPLPRQLSR